MFFRQCNTEPKHRRRQRRISLLDSSCRCRNACSCCCCSSSDTLETTSIPGTVAFLDAFLLSRNIPLVWITASKKKQGDHLIFLYSFIAVRLEKTQNHSSYERHKHKEKIDTKTRHDISFGTFKDKTTRIFLCFVFCLALGLCLDYDLMLMITTILMPQA